MPSGDFIRNDVPQRSNAMSQMTALNAITAREAFIVVTAPEAFIAITTLQELTTATAK